MADFVKKTAYKVKIGDLIKGKYVRREGWDPSYIVGTGNIEISRVNILSIVVGIGNSNPPSMLLDDGTGKIEVRAFEQVPDIEVGSLVNVIGRPREYSNQIFIVPEIIKKIENPKWVEVRNKELEGNSLVLPKEDIEIPAENITEEEKVVEALPKEEENVEESPSQKIYGIIKELDNGDGADTDEVIAKVQNEDAEKIIDNLLKEGDIFEVKNGRLKVLE